MVTESLVSLSSRPHESRQAALTGDIPSMLKAYEKRPPLSQGALLRLMVGDFDEYHRPYDAYNISAPFTNCGDMYIAVRTEPRDKEHRTTTKFFRSKHDVWVEDPEMPTFTLQDPTITRIAYDLVLGGVKTYPLATGGIGYQMEFYKGRTLSTLERFAVGPEHMKGIRLVELPDGKIGVFTRPQGVVNGINYAKGQICYTEIDTLEYLSPATITQAKRISLHFTNGEWGGANEAHVLADRQLGILCHIAKLDDAGGKNYYAGIFTMDPETRVATNMHIIATRDDFPSVPNKRPDEVNIIYPGGLKDNGDGTVDLYAGLGDTSAGKICIPNPFTPQNKLPHAA